MTTLAVRSPCEDDSSVPFSDGCVSYDAAIKSAMDFLMTNLPSWDAVNVVTLFGEPGGVDGLDLGLASAGVNASVDAQRRYPWAWGVPQRMFNEYVATYAFTNEPRTYWRRKFTDVQDVLKNLTHQDDVVRALNTAIWTQFGITFKAGLSPLIFDPISTIAFGYASCTGISTTFAAALRAVGIPARITGTPAWHNRPSDGNHNWVEVWRTTTQTWAFLEGKPAGASETLDNPCSMWFCNAQHFPAAAENQTSVYAARFDRSSSETSFPLAWDPANLEVPGDDRSAYYTATCNACSSEEDAVSGLVS